MKRALHLDLRHVVLLGRLSDHPKSRVPPIRDGSGRLWIMAAKDPNPHWRVSTTGKSRGIRFGETRTAAAQSARHHDGRLMRIWWQVNHHVRYIDAALTVMFVTELLSLSYIIKTLKLILATYWNIRDYRYNNRYDRQYGFTSNYNSSWSSNLVDLTSLELPFFTILSTDPFIVLPFFLADNGLSHLWA